MKSTIIKFVGLCGVGLITAVAGRAGGWLWDNVLQEKANKMLGKLKGRKKNKKFKFEILKRKEA